jgi:hypothetical protein
MSSYTGIARLHRFVSLFSTVWFILGMVWTLKEQTCSTYSYKPYLLAFALMVVSWVSMLAPCLLLLILTPFVFFCAPCVIRFLSMFVEPGEGGVGARQEVLDGIKVGEYQPPPEGSRAQPESDEESPVHGSVSGVGPISNDSCPICLSDFNEGEQIKVLPCSGKHSYHISCIDEWLRINSVCCLCRETIDERSLQRERERLEAQEVPASVEAVA